MLHRTTPQRALYSPVLTELGTNTAQHEQHTKHSTAQHEQHAEHSTAPTVALCSSNTHTTPHHRIPCFALCNSDRAGHKHSTTCTAQHAKHAQRNMGSMLGTNMVQHAKLITGRVKQPSLSKSTTAKLVLSSPTLLQWLLSGGHLLLQAGSRSAAITDL